MVAAGRKKACLLPTTTAHLPGTHHAWLLLLALPVDSFLAPPSHTFLCITNCKRLYIGGADTGRQAGEGGEPPLLPLRLLLFLCHCLPSPLYG